MKKRRKTKNKKSCFVKANFSIFVGRSSRLNLFLYLQIQIRRPVFFNTLFMFRDKIYPYLLVFFQLGSLVVIFLTGPWLAKSWDGIVVEMVGVILGLVAIYVAGIHNVNIAPKPKDGGVLITKWPYSQIRHPMYLAQVVAVIPLIIADFTWFRLAILLTLIVALILKMPYEEKGLVRQFGDDYRIYREQTKKVLPFIY